MVSPESVLSRVLGLMLQNCTLTWIWDDLAHFDFIHQSADPYSAILNCHLVSVLRITCTGLVGGENGFIHSVNHIGYVVQTLKLHNECLDLISIHSKRNFIGTGLRREFTFVTKANCSVDHISFSCFNRNYRLSIIPRVPFSYTCRKACCGRSKEGIQLPAIMRALGWTEWRMIKWCASSGEVKYSHRNV